jgi:hypothetical protein
VTPVIDPVAAIREQIKSVLSNAGAYCGDCGFQPGDRGDCPACERCWDSYADALMPIVARGFPAAEESALAVALPQPSGYTIPTSIPVGVAAQNLRQAVADMVAAGRASEWTNAITIVLDDLERTRADIAQLRRAWAAMSGCLIKQGRHEELTDADLANIPDSHWAYLRGNDALRRQCRRDYDRAQRAEDALRAAGLPIPAGDA